MIAAGVRQASLGGRAVRAGHSGPYRASADPVNVAQCIASFALCDGPRIVLRRSIQSATRAGWPRARTLRCDHER